MPLHITSADLTAATGSAPSRPSTARRVPPAQSGPVDALATIQERIREANLHAAGSSVDHVADVEAAVHRARALLEAGGPEAAAAQANHEARNVVAVLTPG